MDVWMLGTALFLGVATLGLLRLCDAVGNVSR